MLLVAVLRRGIPFEVMLLSAGDPLVLTGIDVYFVAIGRISPIYLADAVAETILIILWVIGWRRAGSPWAAAAKFGLGSIGSVVDEGGGDTMLARPGHFRTRTGLPLR